MAVSSSRSPSEAPFTGYASDDSTDYADAGPDATDFEAYDALMRSRLPSIPPVDLSWMTATSSAPALNAAADDQVDDGEREDEKSMTKAEKQNAKKKRRKERERAAKAAAEAKDGEGEEGVAAGERCGGEESIPFKLFSARPVKAISIVRPIEVYPVTLNPRHLPLNPATAAKIHQAASASAMSWNLTSTPRPLTSTIEPGPSSHQSIPARNLPTIHLSTPTNSAASPNVILILPPHVSLRPPVKKFKSDPSSISRLSRLTDPTPTPERKLSSRQRRRIRVEPYDRPPPSFWAPEVGLGGRARGYAYGYRGSEEGRRERGGYIK